MCSIARPVHARRRFTRRQCENGVPDPSLISPDTWTHDQVLLDRPGNDEIQLRLFRDYSTNVDLYPAFQEYFRTSQVPLPAVWGANDQIFGTDGARAFRRDLPEAEINLLRTLRPGESPRRHHRQHPWLLRQGLVLIAPPAGWAAAGGRGAVRSDFVRAAARHTLWRSG